MGVYYQLIEKLMERYSLEEWWPCSSSPEENRKFEMILGAILTQRTRWENVRKFLEDYAMKGKITPERVSEENADELRKELKLHGIGLYNSKSEQMIKAAKAIIEEWNGKVITLFLGDKDEVKENLKKLPGIGENSAELLLLYAAEFPHFPKDPLALRPLERIREKSYDELVKEIKEEFKDNVTSYKALHGLLAEHAAKTCRKKPKCYECVVEGLCKYEHKVIK